MRAIPPCSWSRMPRNRPALLPLAPAARDEDEGTWMLTFSDLVLLLLAFGAIGILMERSPGPYAVTDRLHASAPAPATPFALVEETPPATAAAPTVAAAQLRALASRLETRIAAEGIPGLRPVVLSATGITIEVGASTAAPHTLPILPRVVPASVTVVEVGHPTSLGASSTHDRALARTARLAHELIAGDPLLAVRAVTAREGDTAPSRVEIRHAG